MDNQLTDNDLTLAQEIITKKQKEFQRKNIPGPMIFEALKGKLSQPFEEAEFRKLFGEAVKANKLPGIASHLGKGGGFGPVKSETHTATFKPEKTTSEVKKIELVQEIKPEIITDGDSDYDYDVELSAQDLVKFNPVSMTDRETETMAQKEFPGLDPDNLIAYPARQFKTTRPGKKWNSDRAREIVQDFLPACLPMARALLKSRLEDFTQNEHQTRALFRIALGWDPSKLKSNVFKWDEFFDER